jgi:hypothetical protein
MDKNTVITLFAGYVVCWVWPNATPKVNEFLKDNLGNETIYQMPERMDEVWYIGMYKFFLQMPLIFQLVVYSMMLGEINRHFMMHFTSIKNLIEFIVFLVPKIVQGVVWVINMIVKFAEWAVSLFVCLFHFFLYKPAASANEVNNSNEVNNRRRPARRASPVARGASPVPELRRSTRRIARV